MKKHNDAYEHLSQEADGLRTQVQELQTTKGTLVDELQVATNSAKKLEADIASINKRQVEALADQEKVTFLFLSSSPTSSLLFIVVLAVPVLFTCISGVALNASKLAPFFFFCSLHDEET
jgi:hypothetical protein